MMASGTEQFVAANKACEASDFSAVLVKSDEKPFFLQSAQSDSTVALFGHSAEKALGRLSASDAGLSAHRVPPELGESLLMSAILRI